MTEFTRAMSHEMNLLVGRVCRCWKCRHDRFNPGPPSMTKRQRRERAHIEALAKDHDRAAKAATIQED